MVEPSTAMLVAAAPSRVTAPSTFFTTEVLLADVLESVFESLATRLATVLVAKFFDDVTLLDFADVSLDEMFFVFELLEDSPNEEDLSKAAVSDSLEALDEFASVAKLSVVAVFAARLLFEDRFKLAFKVPELFDADVLLPEAFLVLLDAAAPSCAVVLLAAVPTLDEVLPPLDALLLNVELPTVPAVPFLPARALFDVEPKLAVALSDFALEAVVPRVPAAD